MSKTEAEILEELEELQEALKVLLSQKDALLFIDLTFFRDRATDLKQELRIAEK